MANIFIICFLLPNGCKRTKEEGEGMCKILKELEGLSPGLLLEKYGINITPPVNLKKLVEKAGISSYPFDFADAEVHAGFEKGSIIGAALSEGDDLTVLYSEGLSDEDARATIAHELAHCCLHAEDLKIDHLELKTTNKRSELDSQKEEQANCFAEELLVPAESLKHICGMLIKPTVTALANIFQVPVDVIKSRKSAFPSLKILDDTNIPESDFGEDGIVAGGVCDG